MSEFSGVVVFITGGTSGIGRGTAVAFAKQGAKVAFTGRREAEGAETLKAIEAVGGKGLFIKSDVSIEADIKKAVKETIDKLGPIEVAFNNAGIEEQPQPFLEQSVEVFDRVMTVNVRGVWLCMQEEIRHMMEYGKGGSIINNSSVAGLVGMAGVTAYVGSKHAVSGMTKCVAAEFGRRNIRVNAVAPGPIKTEMWDRFAVPGLDEKMQAMLPAGRIGEVDEVASCVLWLASKSNSYVTGQTIAVDGGLVVT